MYLSLAVSAMPVHGVHCRHVEGALNEFAADIVIYNAGTDILDGDSLGCLSISPQVQQHRCFYQFSAFSDRITIFCICLKKDKLCDYI